MKNFRRVTITVLVVITILFAGNIYYLYTLYGSIKEQYINTARECLIQADALEILLRMKQIYGFTDTDIDVRIDIAKRMTDTGRVIPSTESLPFKIDEKMLGFFESLHITFSHNLRQSSTGPTDYHLLDSLFITELNRVGLYPENVMVLPADSIAPAKAHDMWQIDYSLFKDSPLIYHAYISPPVSDILQQTAGIITTTALIIMALAFAFIYLIRTIVHMRTLEEMKDDFTNNMTHELKTPIAIAYSANDTLLNHNRHNDPDKRERYLKVALEQLTRLSELVESILSMSMERRKTITLTQERIEVRPFLNEITSTQTLRADKPVDINVDVSPDALTISTDPIHFGNIINNLLDNAIKYSGSSVNIKIHADRNGITVSDDGNGIPAKSLPLIFNKFYRVPAGNRQHIRGYGIGLYYVHTIIEKMGWTINAKSTPGHGSTFTINFQQHEK